LIRFCFLIKFFSLLQDTKRPIYDEIRVDPFFRKINKHSVGFHVFKVDNDHIEALSKDQVGTFYDENAYIVYAASVKGTITDQNTIVSCMNDDGLGPSSVARISFTDSQLTDTRNQNVSRH